MSDELAITWLQGRADAADADAAAAGARYEQARWHRTLAAALRECIRDISNVRAAVRSESQGDVDAARHFDVRTVGWLARDLPEPVATSVTLDEAAAVLAEYAPRVVPSRDAGQPGALKEIYVRAAR